jgi:hypothetical protein
MKFIDTKTDSIYFGILVAVLAVLYFFVASPVFFWGKAKEPAKNEKVNIEQLREHVTSLTSLSPTRTFPNATLEDSAKYIAQYFQSYCDEVSLQKYVVASTTVENIVCSIGISKPGRIVIGAHYDTFGPTPGADDNASGVAGLLELARIIAGNEKKFTERVDLVAFTLEEPPYFRTENMGSFQYALSLKKENVPVKIMVSLETIGYFSEKKDSQHFPHWLLKAMYPNTGNYILIIGDIKQSLLTREFKKHFKDGANISAWSLNGPTNLFGLDFSDHRSFWGFGYPAIMVTDTAIYRNQNYHEKTDTAETLNYEKMAEVVEGVYSGIKGL